MNNSGQLSVISCLFIISFTLQLAESYRQRLADNFLCMQ